MADFKFDGVKLKSGDTVIANVRGNNICKGTGSNAVANIRGTDICSGTGSTKLANLRGTDIRQGSGSTRIGTMRDVESAIDGPGGGDEGSAFGIFCAIIRNHRACLLHLRAFLEWRLAFVMQACWVILTLFCRRFRPHDYVFDGGR